MRIDYEQLAWRCLGYSEIEADKRIDEGVDLDDEMYEEFGIMAGQFQDVAERLIKFTEPYIGPRTGRAYYAFVDHERGIAIVKEGVKNEDL